MATYKLIGQRFLRRYTAAESTPVYASAVEAQKIVNELCGVPWLASDVRTAMMTSHSDEKDESGVSGLDSNVANRESFDAALFCAGHVGGKHRAYANAAVYRYALPDGTLPDLTSLVASITSDPYNEAGARIAIMTNSTGEIPTSCNICRTGDAHLEGVAPRTTRTVGGTDYWYPTTAAAEFSSLALPLQKYLFVFVLMESYSTVRGNWIEGCSYMTKNEITITTSAAVPGWTDGATIDLWAAAPTTHTYNVVKDGVYPDLLSGISGVETIQLQRTGDVLASNYNPPTVKGTDGLRKLSAGAFAKLLDIPAASITCITPFGGMISDSRWDIVAIGGTFDGGTFAEIPGIYLYSVQSGQILENITLDRSDLQVPSSLKSFAADHGGFACVSAAPYLNDEAAWCLMVVGKDGVTYTTEDTTRGSGWAPAIGLKWIGDTLRLEAIFPGSLYDLKSALGVTDPDDVVVSVPVQNWLNGNCFATVAALKRATNKVHVVGMAFYYERNFYGNVVIQSKTYQAAQFPVVGTVSAISGLVNTNDNSTHDLIAVCGELTSVGSVSVTNCAVIRGWLDTDHTVARPAFDQNITPSTYHNFKIFAGIANEEAARDYVITGEFTSLGGDTAFAKIALVSPSTGTVRAVPHPDADTVAAKIALNDELTGCIWHAETPEETPGWSQYEHLHPDVTDAQSAIGLRQLYARLYRGGLRKMSIGALNLGGVRPGALFTVRGDTITVPTGESTSEDVPTWQLTLARLCVAFAAPKAFAARKVKLDWTALSAATAGSKLNVWIRRGVYVDQYPEITDPRIYTAEAKSVDGWQLVGVIDAAGSTSATFDIDPITDDVVSLMFTAFVNLDGLNPSANMTLPQGIGTANIDGVNTSVSGLTSGWKPDITLLG